MRMRGFAITNVTLSLRLVTVGVNAMLRLGGVILFGVLLV